MLLICTDLMKNSEIHTQNEKYCLLYCKGHAQSNRGKNTWIRTRWSVLDSQGSELWMLEGKILNCHKDELFKKFKLDVKTN
jgi:hypothetical protein